MKIVSWNVNGIRACLNKGLLDFLSKQKIDIFCIQETKAHREQVSLEDKEFGFTESYWSEAEKKGYSGTATFVKKLSVPHKLKLGVKKFDNEGRFVITDHGEFVLYNIYFPNGAASDERHFFKMDFLEEINKHMKKQLKSGKEIILVGDYNIARTAIDIHAPKRLDGTSGFKPEEREWFQSFLDIGFTDTFRFKNPEKLDMYSWWSYRAGARERNKGWRIDYICVSEGLKSRIKKAEILTDIMGSDHCPILLELK